ncbi:MAG: DNA polymerase IV [bacterium]
MSESAPHERIVIHADMDAFFASVEQREHPELRGRPVIVAGPPPRGVVSAASYEARKFGIRSAMPTSEAMQRCRGVHRVDGNMKLYAEVSKKIRAVFEEFSPKVEPLSLDEAFIDITRSRRVLHGTKEEIGRRLKRRVLEETGLKVSVGIAEVKMVAKIAGDLSKPDGLMIIEPGEGRAFLAPLPLRRLWGVGPVQCERLERRGLRRIGDLAALKEVDAGSELERLRSLARAEDGREVEVSREARSIGEERTFSYDVEDRGRLREVLVQHADAVARRLRKEELVARVVRLKIKSDEKLDRPGKYRIYTRQVTLAETTDDGRRIAKMACELLQDPSLPRRVRLVGVTAAGLQERGVEPSGQLGLFGAPQPNPLNNALDKIQDRFGSEAIRRGTIAPNEKASPTGQVKRGE